MADLKLFQLKSGKATAKRPRLFSFEKEIQKLCENNLKEFFGIDFLATEYVTGKKHAGRIDTLGIDENSSPVIIEYKLASNENVINQGLYYLDWLMDHKADFELLCMNKFDKKIEVDWSNPRLLCIANDFTKYDDYAIGQINRNIDLIRYRIFEDDFVIFELASSIMQEKQTTNLVKANKYKGIKDHKKKASEKLIELLAAIEEFIFTLGDDIQKKELKYYFAYSRIKNFVCLEMHPSSNKIVIYLKVPYSDIKNKSSKVRDVSKIGHFGTGETEITIETIEDVEMAKTLIQRSYEIS